MSAEEKKSFLLRVAPELWRELEAWAADDLRSVNGQIEFILREAVRRRKNTSGDIDDGGSEAGARRKPH
jgi:hypothetical protein